jgi:hypothetical protein
MEQQATSVLASTAKLPQAVLLQPAPARKLLAGTPTFHRDLEDPSKRVTNSALEAAYKKFEVGAA